MLALLQVGRCCYTYFVSNVQLRNDFKYLQYAILCFFEHCITCLSICGHLLNQPMQVFQSVLMHAHPRANISTCKYLARANISTFKYLARANIQHVQIFNTCKYQHVQIFSTCKYLARANMFQQQQASGSPHKNLTYHGWSQRNSFCLVSQLENIQIQIIFGTLQIQNCFTVHILAAAAAVSDPDLRGSFILIINQLLLKKQFSQKYFNIL